MGDQFLPTKLIKRTLEHQANSTKQLLNAGSEHQTPRKTACYLQYDVGHDIKERETKELGMEISPGKGVKKSRFPNTRKHSLHWVCGALESQREK